MPERPASVNQMSELQNQSSSADATQPSPSPASNEPPPSSPSVPGDHPPPPPSQSPRPRFDPSRMIGIIKRKALIKDLAAVYHAECLAYCEELLELQKKCEEPYVDSKAAEDSRKETMRPSKRLKKSR